MTAEASGDGAGAVVNAENSSKLRTAEKTTGVYRSAIEQLFGSIFGFIIEKKPGFFPISGLPSAPAGPGLSNIIATCVDRNQMENTYLKMTGTTKKGTIGMDVLRVVHGIKSVWQMDGLS